MNHNQYVKIYAGTPYFVEEQINNYINSCVTPPRIVSINTSALEVSRIGTSICTTVVFEDSVPTASCDADELGYLITKLEQYAKEELDAHNNCIAEDLQAAADKLKEMGERK